MCDLFFENPLFKSSYLLSGNRVLIHEYRMVFEDFEYAFFHSFLLI